MTGLQLKLARIEAGAPQFRIAAALGVSPQWISAIECGKRKAPEDFERRFLKAVAEYAQRLRNAGLAPGEDHAR